MAQERRDQFCEKKHPGAGLALFDRGNEVVGKKWRCYRPRALKEVLYSRGFAYDEQKLSRSLFTNDKDLAMIQD